MIIWQGMGILVALILLVVLGTLGPFFNRPDMVEYKAFSDAIIFFVSAALTLLLGLILRRRKAKVFIDAETGQRVEVRRRDTLFFIPVLFWPVIFTGFGVKFLFSESPVSVYGGAVTRASVYYCLSSIGVEKAIAAISSAKPPADFDRLSDAADKAERVRMLKEIGHCGVFRESALPIRFEAAEFSQREYQGVVWRTAKVDVVEMGGHRLEEALPGVRIFRPYTSEDEHFIVSDSGKTW
ncbi:MAG: hypothetical protein LBM17_06360 [Candidatus Accumulibacter sp.]|jgi:hypothetical protein|nr:hypothetical protein [Accumulibacter sp.]